MSFNWSTQGNATLAGKEAQVILDFALKVLSEKAHSSKPHGVTFRILSSTPMLPFRCVVLIFGGVTRRDEQDKVADFNRLIDVAEEKIHGKDIDLEMLEAEGNDG
ncbi:hypothetical protein Tco_0915362 [Tanacetum coccineum]